MEPNKIRFGHLLVSTIDIVPVNNSKTIPTYYFDDKNVINYVQLRDFL